MKTFIRSFCLLTLLCTSHLLITSFQQPPRERDIRLPYREAGLTERQAAAHLLGQLSFGATPAQVEEVVKTGLVKWFRQQLDASFPDKQVEEMLSGFESLKMTNTQIVKAYPNPGQVLKMAMAEGVIDTNAANKNRKDNRTVIKAYMMDNGLQLQAALLKELVHQKILRAAFSDNQLQEVMTDFWFNHFNVAFGKGGVQQFVTAYERDAIRPNSLGNFETLLLATARAPAMLAYLDNNKSTVNERNMMPVQKKLNQKRDMIMDSMMPGNTKMKRPRLQGLNENYAREVMELHTLGVDGGYTQTDVTETARVLTGWTINPEIAYTAKAKQNPRAQWLKMGWEFDDNFLFAANRHDKGEKKVLGRTFPAGGGYEEGVQLIHMLATHPSTAHFISRKLAVRFVTDDPAKSLVDKMAKTFLDKQGNIKEVLITMVTAPEFWSKEVIHQKTKSPFELAISTLRATGATTEAPFQLYRWINKMGQKIYHYQAPTGFPDKGQYWINTGSLLNRMNFGLAFASGNIPGIQLNLLALNKNHEPESVQAALKTYGMLLLPERDLTETIRRLTPMLNDPGIVQKIDQAAAQTTSAKEVMREEGENGSTDKRKNAHMLEQVAGIIIGSPEFQRR